MNLVVAELDTSTIVDPNKNKIIGYESGKQSIAVPETFIKEDGSSNFDEEEFDNEQISIPTDLGRPSEV